MISLRPPRQMTAFTLIEVVFALAVFAFAFMIIIGTLPAGLSAAREAANTVLEAQLVKQVTNTLQETPYTTVTASPSFIQKFSRQGYPVTTTDPVYFTVTGTVVPSTDPSAMLPSSITTTNLSLIKLAVSTADNRTNYYSLIVANLGSQ